MQKFLGVMMVVLALALAIAPVFTDCQSHGKLLTTADGRSVAMKCHWAGIAEIAAAVPLGMAGVAALTARRRETLRFAGLVGVGAAGMALLIPTLLIGTCANPMMACNLLMKPTLLAAGILAIASSAALVVIARELEPALVGAAA
jgi:hypothetical protein